MKGIAKLVVIALSAVAGLGLGYTLAGMVVSKLPASVSDRVKSWLTGFTAFVVAVGSAIGASKLATKFLGAGGPSLDAKLK